jgi:hypothetical protein
MCPLNWQEYIPAKGCHFLAIDKALGPWVGSAVEIVSAVFSVSLGTPYLETPGGELPWCRSDLFTDMVTAGME